VLEHVSRAKSNRKTLDKPSPMLATTLGRFDPFLGRLLTVVLKNRHVGKRAKSIQTMFARRSRLDRKLPLHQDS